MKFWYTTLVLITLLITGCDNEMEHEYINVQIEKYYPFSYEKTTIDDADKDKSELFDFKIHSVNSVSQINELSLFNYCSPEYKEILENSDFNKYTLIITASSSLKDVIGVDYSLKYNINSLEYVCNKTFYTQPQTELFEYKYIYYIINAFLVDKIPDDSKLLLTIGTASLR